MNNALNFVLFQLFWFVAVGGAARGWLWAGPAAVVVFLVVHLAMIRAASERRRELVYALLAGAVGTLLDTGLRAVGALTYPSSEAWGLVLVPPFITSLWVAFALLPRFSLAWLAGRPLLTLVLGAVGGPLSFYAGTRLGAVGAGSSPTLTWGLLALEYALVTPLLLRFAPGPRRRVS